MSWQAQKDLVRSVSLPLSGGSPSRDWIAVVRGGKRPHRWSLYVLLKRTTQGLAVVCAFPFALLCCFGRNAFTYTLFAEMFALAPGTPGSLWRAAFYKLTLHDCSIDIVVGFGSFFSRRQVSVGANVSIGSYCIIGPAKIGARTQISSHVEIPGARQHSRNEHGRLSDSSDAPNAFVTIGSDCWIGASAIVMADVGAQSTIGAGSVVVKDIPACVVAVGSPAKPVQTRESAKE
jgi:virginiamycin A acetyltransferase